MAVYFISLMECKFSADVIAFILEIDAMIFG